MSISQLVDSFINKESKNMLIEKKKPSKLKFPLILLHVDVIGTILLLIQFVTNLLNNDFTAEFQRWQEEVPE